MFRSHWIFVIAIAILSISCNDPITIGTDIEDPIELVFTDTITLDTKTVQGDTTATFTLGVNNTTYLLGALDDTYFGQSNSEIYFELRYGSTLPDFQGSTLDSVVLVLQYDTLGVYGDTTAVYDVEIRQMDERMEGDTIRSNRTFALQSDIIGSKSFVPRLTDSIMIDSHTDTVTDLVTISPQFRIPMTTAFGDFLFNADPINYVDDETLEEFIKGLYIKATPSSSSMIGLNLGDANNLSGANALRVYYTDEEDVKRIYDFTLSSRTFAHFDHDISGSAVEAYLADEDFNGDDLAFYQSMSGVEAEFSFPSIIQFQDAIINKAELVYYSTILDPQMDQVLDPIDLTTTTYINTDGERVLTVDASIAISNGPYTSVLGGVPERVGDLNVFKHTINMTNHVNTLLNNPELARNVRLTALQRSERSSRTIIFGSGASQYQPVLRLSYTNI